jgi:hypothetical protein
MFPKGSSFATMLQSILHRGATWPLLTTIHQATLMFPLCHAAQCGDEP